MMMVVTVSLVLSPAANNATMAIVQHAGEVTSESRPSPRSDSPKATARTNLESYSPSPNGNVASSLTAVGSEPWAVVYDAGKGEIFVANRESGNVSVISDSTNHVVASIPVGSDPYGVAYDSAKGEIFVADSNVTVINDTTNQVVSNIPVSGGPLAITYDGGKGEIFVAEYSGNVSIINDTTNTVVATVYLGAEPTSVHVGYQAQDLVYDRAKGEVFVAVRNVTVAIPNPNGYVAVISDSTNRWVGNISVGIDPNALAYDSGRGEIFVGSLTMTSFSTGETNEGVINDTTDHVIANIGVGGAAAAAYASDVGAVFVVTGNELSVINDKTNAVVASLLTDYGQNGYPCGVAVAYDGGKGEVFVAIECADAVQVFPTNLTAGVALTPSRSSIDVGQPVELNTTALLNDSSYSYVYAFASTSGCIPSTGPSISCVPAAVGNFTVSVNITDALGSMGRTNSGTVRVYSALISNVALSNSTVWLGDSFFISGNATGGLPPYTYNFTGLPPGCVSQGTDRIGCLPTESGNYTISFTVRDSNNWSLFTNRSFAVTFDFTILAPAQCSGRIVCHTASEFGSWNRHFDLQLFGPSSGLFGSGHGCSQMYAYQDWKLFDSNQRPRRRGGP